MSSELDNLTCESKVNSQKSAEVIVPIFAQRWGRTEQLGRTIHWTFILYVEADNPNGLT
ncbi:hypothetical protein ACEOWJ_000919 [Bacillus cereus]|uniref:hypothetical protein n=1 Tax=Bacillus TaxID=1386 RepID=UPI0012E04D03|nr:MULTISPECIES: hypothetical protein [unclassified Bacillus (in: firmicutes)]